MTNREDRLFVVISAILVFTLFLTLLSGNVFEEEFATLKKASMPGCSNTIDINWEELYPYDTVVEEIELPKTSQEMPKTTTFGQIINDVSEYGFLGNIWAKSFLYYLEIAKFSYTITSNLTDTSVGAPQIKLKNGYWVWIDYSKLSLDDVKNSFVKYASLNNYLAKKGIKLLYCYPPDKLCKLGKELPDGAVLYNNQNLDTCLQALKQFGIDCIDLRSELHKDGLNHYSLFFKTDHHWNMDGALWAASAAEKAISNRYGIPMKNVYNLGSYKRKTYKNAMFGWNGQSVTHSVEKSEDFDVLYPEFATKFRLEISNKCIDTIGSFEDIFIDYDYLKSAVEAGGSYAYESILYGNCPYTKITNLKNPRGAKILVIGDSFSVAATPYLALSCSELVRIDTRKDDGNFSGSIINCINKFSPDVVLVLQYLPQELTLNKVALQ